MSTQDVEKQKIVDLIQLLSLSDKRITSTGASIVTFTGGLYNVTGSTTDPKKVPDHEGKAWKQLLIAYGIADTSSCYVTNPGAEKSHPAFSVGGHMTTASDGKVAMGGSCYLMPLCSWHNSTSKDGTLFNHTATTMLLLTGYMQGELAATFQLRLPSPEPFGLLYNFDGGWRHKNFASKALANKFLTEVNSGQGVEHHLFERHPHSQILSQVSSS